jgi:hypothetical protein
MVFPLGFFVKLTQAVILVRQGLSMAVILSNNIALPGKRERFNKAVLEGMERLPDSWKASIFEPRRPGAYVEVTIEGPGTFAWAIHFTGPDEQEAGFIKTTLRNGLLPFLTDK